MTDILSDKGELALLQGLQFLRSRARSAHAAGDGFVVNHVCRIAQRAISRSLGGPSEPLPIDLKDVRWVFCLWLHWLLGYELSLEAVGQHTFRALLNRLPRSQHSEHDFIILTVMFNFLDDPTSSFQSQQALELPQEWFEQRSDELEDIALLSLSAEFAWFSNKSADAPWKALLDDWLAKCRRESPLALALETLRRRLVIQSELCQGGQHEIDCEPSGLDPHATLPLFAQCWQAFLECEWEQLDKLIAEVSTTTRVDASEYLPLFNLLHASRPFRPQSDDQSVSLSRRFYGMSRQPAQVFHSFRSHRNTETALRLRLQPDPNPGVLDRWECLVVSMLEQLSALRAWDLGRWLQAVGQQGDYHLELARFGNADHAKRAVMCYVLALHEPKKGKDSWFDDAILLLDRLGSEERSELVRWLLARRPVERRGAHRVIEELSDSISTDLIAEAARWTVQLSLGKKLLTGWSLTYLKFWSSILPYSEHRREIAEILLPAILRDAAISACWSMVADTLIICISELSLTDARTIIERMITPGAQSYPNQAPERWHIILNACLRRAELFNTYKQWMVEQPEFNAMTQFMIRRIESSQGWNLSPKDLQAAPEDNKAVRDWMRMEMRDYFDRILPEQGSLSTVQMTLPSQLVSWVSWPEDESELVESAINAVGMRDALVATKVGPLKALGFLALRLPGTSANRICDQAVVWLHSGVPGRGSPSIGGPDSIAQISGINSGSVFPAVLFLTDLCLSRSPGRIAEPVANWLHLHGTHQPSKTAHRIFLMMARLGLAPGSAHLDFIGISEAVVNQATAEDAAACIRSFRYLLAPSDGTIAVMLAGSLPARKLLLRLWEVRLAELAQNRLPSVRREVALTIKAWQDLEAEHPDLGSAEPLNDVLLGLSKDPRASVRHATRSRDRAKQA
jgi:hypothetical protein